MDLALVKPPWEERNPAGDRSLAEMFWSGDWIVPRQQGLPFLSRPPVQNWAIALVSLVRGKIDAVAVRLPSVVAVLLTVTLIYAYGRTFLSRLGALCAMVAFPTMGLVLQFGWLGETEAIYTLVVAGSLIVWRWADAAGKSLKPRPDAHAAWGWCGGYGLAALGMLTKGPQAPVYFIGGVAIFLLAMRRGRELLRWQHAAGPWVVLGDLACLGDSLLSSRWTGRRLEDAHRRHRHAVPRRQLDADAEASCRVPLERRGLHVALVRAAAGLSPPRLPPQYCIRSRGRLVSRLVDRICRAQLLRRARGAEPLSGADPALGRAADRPGGPTVLHGRCERVAGATCGGTSSSAWGWWPPDWARGSSWRPPSAWARCRGSNRRHLRWSSPWPPWLRWRVVSGPRHGRSHGGSDWAP